MKPSDNIKEMLERFQNKNPMTLLAEKMGIEFEDEDDGVCPCCGHKEEL